LSKFFTGPALLLLFVCAALAGEAEPPMIRCAPGWRAEIVAQAPAISAPSVVCCSPDGRIFVGQDLMDMGSPTDKPGDRILCIYPDGKITVFATNLYAVFGLLYMDGKVYVHHSPKFSVFDDDNGVGVNRKDLIARDNPHPWLPSFNDHIPSGFRLAMDGYFYISTGDKGIYGAMGKDGRQIEMRGGIYRMRPDGTGLEVYCTGTRNHLDIAVNSEDEMFTYDNTDDGAGWWTRLTHMVDGGYYGYPYDYKPRQPYTLWMMTDWDGQTGAPTGACCYDEDALPPDYQGNLFLCDWSDAAVLRVKVNRKGGTYEMESRVQDQNLDFVTRGGFDIRFRPVGICVTPDGMGFYLTDWGLPGWKNGQVLGRLFKVTYAGKSLAAPKPDWYIPAATGQKFEASTVELIQALSHPAESVRLVAQRRLAERGREGEEQLASLLADQAAASHARWSAIWTLDAIDGGQEEHKAILSALQDKDATVHAQAAREQGTRQAKDAAGPLIAMLDSTNDMLCFRAATALGRIGDRAAVEPLKEALAQMDLFARYAAFKALNRIGLADAAAWPQIVDGFANLKPEIREGVLFATRETYDPDLVKALAAFLSRQNIPTESRTNVLNLLSSLYQKPPPWNGEWWNAMPVNGPPPAKSLDWEGTPVVAAAMCEALPDGQPAVRQIAFDWARSSHDTNAAGVLRNLYEHETDTAMRASILLALPPVDDPDSRALIGPILKNPQAPIPLLEAAIEDVQLIGGNEWNDDLIRLSEDPVNTRILVELFQVFGKNKLSQTAPLLGQNLASSNADVRTGAIAALIQMGDDAAIAQFLPGLNDPSVDIRRQSIEALGMMRAKAAVPQLIKLSADSQLSASAIRALTQMPDMAALDIYLDGLASKNAVLRFQCQTALASLRDAALPQIEAKLDSTNGLPDETIASLKEMYQTNAAAKNGPLFKIKTRQIPAAEYQSFALAHPGQSGRGRKIFLDVNGVNCVRCHRINGQGGQIGPDLTDVGAKQDCAQIVESVLYPSKLILDGYQQVIFHMKDDEEFAGIVRAETADTVTLIDSAETTNLLQKSNIKNRQVSQISLMPEGLQTGLSLEEFSDLIAFIQNPHIALAAVLGQEGKTDEALVELRKALALHFETSLAVELAVGLKLQGRIKDAIAEYRTILGSNPDLPEALNNLAWIFAACSQPEFRNGPEAVQLAARACALTHDSKPMVIGTQAAAYAEAGLFDDAVVAAQKAHDVAVVMGLTNVAARNLDLLQLYRSHRAFHEAP
jgi:putative heme-binding domain-containing protein